MQRNLITAAKYARLRGLNRSTVSRQIAAGQIPTVDGQIDPAEADRARERNLDQARKQQAARRKAAAPKAKRPTFTPALQAAAPAAIAVARDVVFRIAGTDETLKFARFALELGCAPELAYALGHWHSTAAALAIEELDVEDLEGLSEPTHAEWERAIGTFDQRAADAFYDRAASFAD